MNYGSVGINTFAIRRQQSQAYELETKQIKFDFNPNNSLFSDTFSTRYVHDFGLVGDCDWQTEINVKEVVAYLMV
jgi:hypothetical protein